MQLAIMREALRLLHEASEPKTVEYLDRRWPDIEAGRTAWLRSELPPIIKMLVER